MGDEKEKIIVTKNGIRIKGDVSALGLYIKGGQSDGTVVKKEDVAKKKSIASNISPTKAKFDAAAKERKRAKREEKKAKKAQKYKVKKAKGTKAEKRKKTTAQKRIEEFHLRMEKAGLATRSSFKMMQKVNWILDWNYVMFKNGYIVIYAHSTSNIKFSPLKAYVTGSLESFNYLKNYLNKRLPPVRCEIEKLQLRIIDKISFDEAIQQFAIAARQGVLRVNSNGSNTMGALLQMSFSQALSKARQMTPEEFRKYKSKYIDYLVSLQSEKYKIIPCVERLAHSNSDTTEYAFMFSIECKSGKILIIYENVNPDRSTLLFLVNEEDFDRTIRGIYDFLQSAEINKRSSLRDRNIAIKNAGIQGYRSINHNDLYSWKSSITAYKNYR